MINNHSTHAQFILLQPHDYDSYDEYKFTNMTFKILFVFIILENITLLPSANSSTLAKNLQRSKTILVPDPFWNTKDGTPTKIVGHRGEKVLMPEHTLASYQIGVIEKADYVEPDLVLTKDGILVCHHDLVLGKSTDVSQKPEFAKRKRAYQEIHDAGNYTFIVRNEWFIQDLTLAELKTLRKKQKEIGIRPRLFDGLFQIPTFEEYLDTVADMSFKQNHVIGIIPELKNPSFHNSKYLLNAPNFMEDEVLRILKKKGYPLNLGDLPSCTTKTSNGNSTKITCGDVILQSFEMPSLNYLNTRTSRDLMLLVYYDYMLLTPSGLDDLKGVIDYIGLWKEMLVSGTEAVIHAWNQTLHASEVNRLGGFIPPTKFVNETHKRGMKTGIYSIYDSHEKSYRGCAIQCYPENKTEELFYFFEMGVDSMFVENIPEARELRMQYEYEVQISRLRSCAMLHLQSYSIVIIVLLVLSYPTLL